ncbi:hypothetical protein U9M48_004238 [Paspalum notatum var. saurae]|uniref:Uncharacterized protein n=1 Tax=Paspalum notatum var. saurae TaxID=547442 RepID=A0AAQ3PMK2_PASNO
MLGLGHVTSRHAVSSSLGMIARPAEVECELQVRFCARLDGRSYKSTSTMAKKEGQPEREKRGRRRGTGAGTGRRRNANPGGGGESEAEEARLQRIGGGAARARGRRRARRERRWREGDLTVEEARGAVNSGGARGSRRRGHGGREDEERRRLGWEEAAQRHRLGNVVAEAGRRPHAAAEEAGRGGARSRRMPGERMVTAAGDRSGRASDGSRGFEAKWVRGPTQSALDGPDLNLCKSNG